nr:ankyrin repeat domain-containing protein SOWAHB isoform X2 [Hydra vulgaris]
MLMGFDLINIFDKIIEQDDRCRTFRSQFKFNSRTFKSFHKDKKVAELNKLEKSWFSAAAECDILKLKQYYGNDKDLLNKKDIFTGYAAVHWAAKKGDLDLFLWFLEQKADFNLRTNGGYTPLHIAAIQNKENVIRYLIQYCGVDVDLRDYSGRKACNYIKETASFSLKNLIQYKPSYLNFSNEVLDIIRSPLTNSKIPILNRQDMEKEDFDDRRKKKLNVVQSFRSKKGYRRYFGDKQDSYQHRSLIDISTNSTDHVSNPSLTNDPPFRRRNSTISELIVNGYAGFIREKKIHSNNSDENSRRSVSSECSEDSQEAKEINYNINTWV